MSTCRGVPGTIALSFFDYEARQTALWQRIAYMCWMKNFLRYSGVVLQVKN